jgi:hypothetical protein
MDDSLLVSVSSYRPRPGRESIEDFITESFAWLLRSREKLQKEFIEKIDSRVRSENNEVLDFPKTAQWSTQVSFPTSRPDMVARADGRAIAFEHKIHEAASPGQLRRHKEGLNEEHGGGKVVLITSAKWHYRDPADAKITWRDIYRWLGRRAEEDKMVREFRSLLDSRGLGPRTPIDETALRAFFPVEDVREEIVNQMQIIRDRAEGWDFLFDALPHLKREEIEFKQREGTEGRIGIRFNPWSPGVYAGILVDGGDHEVEMGDRDLGPDLIVTLDVGSDGVPGMSRREFLQSNLYSRLASRLKREGGENAWRVTDTYGRSKKGNPYHPLVLQRPLAEVIRGANSPEEQLESIVEALKDGLGLLIAGKEIREAGEKN